MHPVSSTPSFHTPRPPAPDTGPTGPGKSAQSVGHRAKAAVADAREAGLEVPKNAQGYAASMIAKGADPATLFAALVQEPPQETPATNTEPAITDLDGSAPVEGEPVESAEAEGEPVESASVENEPVESAPVEGEPAESAPVEDTDDSDIALAGQTTSPPETADEPDFELVDPAIDLADAALTDDEAALQLLNDILDQPDE